MALKSGFVSRDATLQRGKGMKYFDMAHLRGTRSGPSKVLRKLLAENMHMARKREYDLQEIERKRREGGNPGYEEKEVGKYREHRPKVIAVGHTCNPPAENLLGADVGEVYEVTNIKLGPVALSAIEKAVGLGAPLLSVIWGDGMARGEDGALAKAREIAKDIMALSPAVASAVAEGRLAVVASALRMADNALIIASTNKEWEARIEEEKGKNEERAKEGLRPKELPRRRTEFLHGESPESIMLWNGFVANNNQLVMRGTLRRDSRLFSIWAAMLMDSDARVSLPGMFSIRASNHLFAVRNSGPAMTTSTLEALEGLAGIGNGEGSRVPLLGVIGHAKNRHDADAGIVKNCEKLCSRGESPAIRKLVDDGRVGVVGLRYSLGSGRLDVVFSDGAEAPSEETIQKDSELSL